MIDRRTFIAAVILSILAAPGAVMAQTFAPETLARDFRIDFEAHPGPDGTSIDGYVYNQARMSADRSGASFVRSEDAWSEKSLVPSKLRHRLALLPRA
jgi:hypothetical protein